MAWVSGSLGRKDTKEQKFTPPNAFQFKGKHGEQSQTTTKQWQFETTIRMQKTPQPFSFPNINAKKPPNPTLERLVRSGAAIGCPKGTPNGRQYDC